MHFTRCYHIYDYLRKPYVKEYSANAFPFALSVHLIDCVLFASTIQTLYKCTFYFYLHFIGFACLYYKTVLKTKSTRIGNVLFFIHLYKKKKDRLVLHFKSMYKFRMLLSKKYLRKKNLSMTCLRKLLYFFINKINLLN